MALTVPAAGAGGRPIIELTFIRIPIVVNHVNQIERNPVDLGLVDCDGGVFVRLAEQTPKLERLVDLAAGYGIDAALPGQLFASIERCPWHDGSVQAVDDAAARRVPGVIAIVPIEGPEPGAPYTVLASGVAVSGLLVGLATRLRRGGSRGAAAVVLLAAVATSSRPIRTSTFRPSFVRTSVSPATSAPTPASSAAGA